MPDVDAEERDAVRPLVKYGLAQVEVAFDMLFAGEVGS